jgi:Domain of unknown function (DUF4136)
MDIGILAEGGVRGPYCRRRGGSSVAVDAARCVHALAALLVLLCLGGCTDLRLSRRSADPVVPIASHTAFRFARAPLAEETRAAPAAQALDSAVRDAIAAALQRKGYAEAGPADPRVLVLDYVYADVGGVNARRLDSPSDYQRSWRTGGPEDGTGSMDHTVADVAFYRELTLTVLLFPSSTGALAWEGTARQSFPGALPQGPRLEAAVGRMVRRLLEPLPAAH